MFALSGSGRSGENFSSASRLFGSGFCFYESGCGGIGKDASGQISRLSCVSLGGECALLSGSSESDALFDGGSVAMARYRISGGRSELDGALDDCRAGTGRDLRLLLWIEFRDSEIGRA